MTDLAGESRQGRRVRRRAGRYEAWGLLALLAPHVVMGAWLLVVPDHVAFTTSQCIVLTHVALGLVGLPVAAVWAYRHIVQSRPRTRRTAIVVTARRLLTAATALAFVSGVTTIGSSQGMPMAQGHALLGIALSAALIWHLIVERRMVAACGVVAVLVASIAFVAGARAKIQGDLPDPVSPAFAYELRDSGLYEEAAWCGSCHVQNYDEWKQSTHGHSMDIPQLRADLAASPEVQLVDLENVGQVLHAPPGSQVHQQPPISQQCPLCHAPLTYYSDDRVPVLETKGVAREGITCSFCHTLRGVRPVPAGVSEAAREFIRDLQRGARSLKDVEPSLTFQSTPFYVSAPETVRRYLGQGSPNPVVRWVGDYLIRWRPALHRRDYHSPFIDSSQACEGCHGAATDAPETPDKSYPDWAASDYNTSDANTRVECHDCHMAREVSGHRVTEPGRTVPWGPVRPQRRSHLFLGGNAAAALRFGYPETAAQQRELGRRTLRLSLDDTVIEDGRVRARVTVKNEAVGHFFPAIESLFRFAFIRLAAIDASGKLIAESPRPGSVDDSTSGTPVLYRWVNQANLQIVNDTTIAPHQARTFEAWVSLPPGSPEVSRVEARLGHNFDSEAFLVISGPLSSRSAMNSATGDTTG